MKKIFKVNLAEKSKLFDSIWDPKIIGELNDQHVKIAHFLGEFGWHKHVNEDELFLVISGNIEIEVNTNSNKGGNSTIEVLNVNEGEFVIIPKNTLHNPKSNQLSTVILIEPHSTINTGNINNNLTKITLESI